MKKEPITKLFSDLFDGSPWIDVNLMDTLRSITAEQAAKKISGRNSIWEITNHIISWRQNVLQRVQSKEMKSPGNNYFEPVRDQSTTAWQNTLARLKEAQGKWVAFLQNADADTFSKSYPSNNMTYYEHIHGILQHDAYHLGQIVLLTKLLQ